MITYPISFNGEVHAPQGMRTSWETSASNFKQICAVPKEFEGPGEALSPEDYFLLAIQNCFVATFKVYAEYSRLNFEKLSVFSELIVDKNQEAKPMMKTIKLNIQLHNSSDEKKAQLLITKTLENGFILQSVKTNIHPSINLTKD